MASVTQIGGLITGTAGKVESISGAIGGILCLPQLVMDELAAIVNQSISILLASPIAMANALLGIVNDTINAVVNNIVGALKNLIASIKGIIDSVIQSIQNIKDFVNRVKNNLFNKDNCNFNAANLLKCITANVANNIKKSDISKINDGVLTIANKAQEISNKIAEPGAVLTSYLNKTSSSLNRATNTINTLNRI
jgi:phage-related protein